MLLHVACCMLHAACYTSALDARTAEKNPVCASGGTNALLFFYSVLQCLFCEALCVRTLPTYVQSSDRLILTGHRRSKVKRSDGVKANQRAAEGSLSWGNVTKKKKQHNSVTGVLLLLTVHGVDLILACLNDWRMF